MIGVVIFKNTRSGRVILWCEENQELVHFSEKAESANGGPLEMSDVVSFELQESSDGLWAYRVNKLDDTWGRALVDEIKRLASIDETDVALKDNVVSLRAAISKKFDQMERLAVSRSR